MPLALMESATSPPHQVFGLNWALDPVRLIGMQVSPFLPSLESYLRNSLLMINHTFISSAAAVLLYLSTSGPAARRGCAFSD